MIVKWNGFVRKSPSLREGRGGLPFPSGGLEGWGWPKLPAPVGEG
jgi:hypothetical protein